LRVATRPGAAARRRPLLAFGPLLGHAIPIDPSGMLLAQCRAQRKQWCAYSSRVSQIEAAVHAVSLSLLSLIHSTTTSIASERAFQKSNNTYSAAVTEACM